MTYMQNIKAPYLTIAEQDAGDVGNPDAAHQRLFIDTADNKVKRKNSSGTSSPVEPGDFSIILAATMDYLAENNSDPIDTKLTQGSYISLIYFASHDANSWKDATNAIHTVTAGKVLIPVYIFRNTTLPQDSASRRMRLYNTTDSTDVIGYLDFLQGGIIWSGDGATASKLFEVAAAKVVKLGIWNVNTTKRAAGGFVICKEV